jgi:hypothetical protein
MIRGEKYKINEFLMPQKKRRSASTQSPNNHTKIEGRQDYSEDTILF